MQPPAWSPTSRTDLWPTALPGQVCPTRKLSTFVASPSSKRPTIPRPCARTARGRGFLSAYQVITSFVKPISGAHLIAAKVLSPPSSANNFGSYLLISLQPSALSFPRLPKMASWSHPSSTTAWWASSSVGTDTCSRATTQRSASSATGPA